MLVWDGKELHPYKFKKRQCPICKGAGVVIKEIFGLSVYVKCNCTVKLEPWKDEDRNNRVGCRERT